MGHRTVSDILYVWALRLCYKLTQLLLCTIILSTIYGNCNQRVYYVYLKDKLSVVKLIEQLKWVETCGEIRPCVMQDSIQNTKDLN